MVHSLSRNREAARHRERYVKEERSTVQSCHSPRQRAADGTKTGPAIVKRHG